MKTKLILFFIILTAHFGWSQAIISSTGTPIIENFTSFIGSAATLPSNWTTSGTGSNGNAFHGTNQATGGSGGWYGNSNMSFLGSGNASNGNATWRLVNNTGNTITSFDISFLARMFKTGSASPAVSLSYSTNATGTVPAAGILTPILNFNDATANILFDPTLSQSGISVSIPNGSFLFIRFLHAGGSNSDNLGWDDVSITANVSANPPTLIPDTTLNTVDNNIDINFTDNSTWRAAITAVKIGTTTLTPTTDYTITAGNLQLKPSGLNVLLTTSGTKTVTVVATGYTDATVSQVINAGVPTTNSTATINAALAVGTSRTITCTAKDQYNNLVSGYTFAYDVTITNNNSTTAESYTIDNSPFTSTDTNGNPVMATTNATGVATFTAVLPATIDSADGISIQVQLTNNTTNIGTAFSFTQLATQTITFGVLSAVIYGDAPLALSASANSGLTVSYTSSNPAVASITGNTVTFLSNGSVTINASQAGNATYNAATNVLQTLTINQKILTVSPVAANNKVYDGTNAATITGTLTGIVGSDLVTFVGTGTFASADTAMGIAVSSASTLGGTHASKYLLTQPTALFANITQAPQTISVTAVVSKTIGDAAFSAGATSATSATNSLNYTSSNPAVATINASGLITIVSVGTTTITVSQAGSLNYTAATNATIALTIKPLPIAAWQLNGRAGNETSVNAGTLDTNLNTSTLIRGSGLTSTILNNAFSSTNYTQNGTKAGEIAANKFMSFTLNAKSGYKVSLSTLDVRFRRSSNGPNTFRWQYSIDGSTFTDIGTADINFTNPTADGLSQTQLSLSSIPELQNVGYANTITFRLVAWGATNTTGTFAIGRSLATIITNPTDYSLQIGGTVTVKEAIWQSGVWTNTVGPDATLDAVIKDTYVYPTNGAFTAKNLTVATGGALTVNSGSTINLADAITNNLTAAKVVFENGASLLQTNIAASNLGNITYKRTTSALANNNDFVYIGSPVFNPTLGSAWMTSANDTFYSFNNAATPQDWAYATPSTLMAAGVGYIARTKIGSTGWTTLGSAYTINFIGKPNNGNVPVTLINNGSTNIDNLISNPYPSAIDIALFRNDIDNKDFLTGNFYFWTHNTALDGSNNYQASDYAILNVALGASVATSPSGATPLSLQYVAAGQGFFAEAAGSGGIATFKNDHRVASNNTNNFYRTSTVNNGAASDKLWLNLSNNIGLFKQQLVAYTQNATIAYDQNYDAKSFEGNTDIDFYSIIPTKKLAIQSRPNFTTSDLVELGYKASVSGNYTIAIDHSDGLFANRQAVFLQDNLLGLDYDLTTASYNFSTAAGTFDNRFILKYSSALATTAHDYLNNSVSVAFDNKDLKIKSVSEDIKSVAIFDLLGRKVYFKNNNSAKDFIASKLSMSNQTMIIKIELSSGAIITRKMLF
jgi:hypothetical protein